MMRSAGGVEGNDASHAVQNGDYHVTNDGAFDAVGDASISFRGGVGEDVDLDVLAVLCCFRRQPTWDGDVGEERDGSEPSFEFLSYLRIQGGVPTFVSLHGELKEFSCQEDERGDETKWVENQSLRRHEIAQSLDNPCYQGGVEFEAQLVRFRVPRDSEDLRRFVDEALRLSVGVVVHFHGV